METILDLEGTAILSTACKFSLTSISVRTDFFPSERKTHNTHIEDFDTLLGSEPDITCPLPTRESDTTIPEIGNWRPEGNSPTIPELGTWTTIDANSTAKVDNWSPSSTEIDLFAGNVSSNENAYAEDGCQEISSTTLQETSYSKSHNVRVIKHKPSAITFTDLPLDLISHGAGYDNDTQEDKESGDDAEEDVESDDVFTDLPRYKYTFTSIKRRSSHPRSPTHKIFIDSKEFFQGLSKKDQNNGTDLDEEERKTSTVGTFYSIATFTSLSPICMIDFFSVCELLKQIYYRMHLSIRLYTM